MIFVWWAIIEGIFSIILNLRSRDYIEPARTKKHTFQQLFQPTILNLNEVHSVKHSYAWDLCTSIMHSFAALHAKKKKAHENIANIISRLPYEYLY
jgi:hypothetical protein